MRKLPFLILLTLLLCRAAAQQYNNWYFGLGAGISFNANGPTLPYVLTDGMNGAHEGNASISDMYGHLLFYTNGQTIYNKLHQEMLNGDNLRGHQSAAQSSLIIPMPGNDSIYYVITTDAIENNYANGYCYSIVNIHHDSGKGEVIQKNILLNSSCTERLAAARHANGTDVWIIGNERNSTMFKAWLLNCTGLQPVPVISSVGILLNDAGQGVMKVSPDGKQLCQTNFPELPGNVFQLFDFDNATGILFNARTITNPDAGYFSCEFSPDSKLLYVTRVAEKFIDQFEPKLGSAAAINASRVSIPANYGFYGIQTGPDKKIYLNRLRTSLSVISQPNIKGIGCTFEEDKINLGFHNGALGLPSAINDGPVDPNNDFICQVIDSCNGGVQFYGQTNMGGAIDWSWDFGDGNVSQIQNPQHIFASTDQLYYVKLVIKSPASCGFIEIVKQIAPAGMLLKPAFDLVPKCDSGYIRLVNTSTVYPADPSIQFTWDFGDGTISTDRDPIHSYASGGSYTVKLKIKSITGPQCLNDSTDRIINLDQLIIQVPPSQTIEAGQTVQLSVTGGGTGFQWSPPQWLSDPDIQNPIAKPLNDIRYTVSVTNDAGCKAKDSVFIHVKSIDGIFVPTAFTPDNNGLNDLIIPNIGTQYTLATFSIYNRWGQKIFSTSEAGKGWDGKMNGRFQEAGTYAWVIIVTDTQKKKIEKKGTVTLIR